MKEELAQFVIGRIGSLAQLENPTPDDLAQVVAELMLHDIFLIGWGEINPAELTEKLREQITEATEKGIFQAQYHGETIVVANPTTGEASYMLKGGGSGMFLYLLALFGWMTESGGLGKCELCGKIFMYAKRRKIFCSNACRQKNYRRKVK